MKWGRETVACLVSVVFIGMMAAVVAPQTAHAVATLFVQVTNTGSNPVPTTVLNLPATQAISGNVGISGTPTVQVTGMPTVQLAAGTTVGLSGGTVSFSNTPSTPIFTRDRDNPTLAPFSTQLCQGLNRFNPGASLCGNESDTFTVGASQRLVIEYVSFYCDATGSGVMIFDTHISTTSGGNSGAYFFSPVHTISSELSFANQQTRIYADPGTMVSIGANTTDTTSGTPTCFANLSGYLVTP